MKQLVVGILAALVLVLVPQRAHRPVQDGLVRDENGDGHRRGRRSRNPHVTLKKPDGTYVTTVADRKSSGSRRSRSATR
jgi:hypothetical protein